MKRIVTIGFFDGVHLGHQALFDILQKEAHERSSVEPYIYTFREHPKEVLTGVCPPLLTTFDERLERLLYFGNVYMQDFRSIQKMRAEEYLRLLHDRDNVRYVLMGYDHRFGSDGITQFDDYVAVGKSVGVTVIQCPEYIVEGHHASSSQIRRLLEQGCMAEAKQLLGYDYRLTGVVEHGNGIGRQIGVPTANLCVPNEKLIPAAGVYEGEIEWSAGINNRCFSALVNIGTNPTVGNSHVTIEVHILGYEGDLYDKELTVSLKRYLRPEQRFSSLEALRAQIACDIQSITP